MLEIKEISDSKVWEEFQSKQEFSNILQSWEWGEFQASLNRKVWFLGIYNSNQLQGTCMAHIIPTKLRTHIYTSMGPTLDWSNKDVQKAIIEYLKKLGKQENVKFVRLDPMIEENEENLRMLKSRGLVRASTNVQAERKWYLDISPTEKELLQNMKKNTRYSVNRAEREGVVVKNSTDISDFNKFWGLFNETVERQKFVPHTKNYYESQIKSFPGKYRIYWTEYKGEILSTALIPFYGNTVFYLHAATSSNRVKNTFPAHTLIWNAIKDAKAEGLKYLDFWGIAPTDDPKHPWAGYTFFKKGFGGFDKRLIRAHDLPLSPQYQLVRLLESTRRLWGRAYFNITHR
jgi:lipid II:glycine glycyltransferase (peptidoglycan interpeptide bridge formation enzyme)